MGDHGAWLHTEDPPERAGRGGSDSEGKGRHKVVLREEPQGLARSRARRDAGYVETPREERVRLCLRLGERRPALRDERQGAVLRAVLDRAERYRDVRKPALSGGGVLRAGQEVVRRALRRGGGEP